ncbi:MAG: hypothetical protein WCF07_08980, partial [Nitrososphaeraceae archaeon]
GNRETESLFDTYGFPFFSRAKKGFQWISNVVSYQMQYSLDRSEEIFYEHNLASFLSRMFLPPYTAGWVRGSKNVLIKPPTRCLSVYSNNFFNSSSRGVL